MAGTVLVVDDNRGVRDALELVLELHGYRVVTAGSGGEALTLTGSVKPDLVLLDTAMPEMSGHECRARLNDQGDAVPVLLLCTGACNPADCQPDSCVEKFDLDGLLGTVDRLLPRAA